MYNVYIYMYIILSAFRNAINTTIISCGRNETWSHHSKTFRHSIDRLDTFLRLMEHDFVICGFLIRSSV